MTTQEAFNQSESIRKKWLTAFCLRFIVGIVSMAALSLKKLVKIPIKVIVIRLVRDSSGFPDLTLEMTITAIIMWLVVMFIYYLPYHFGYKKRGTKWLFYELWIGCFFLVLNIIHGLIVDQAVSLRFLVETFVFIYYYRNSANLYYLNGESLQSSQELAE